MQKTCRNQYRIMQLAIRGTMLSCGYQYLPALLVFPAPALCRNAKQRFSFSPTLIAACFSKHHLLYFCIAIQFTRSGCMTHLTKRRVILL
jgi:hypothetical protein